MGTDKLPTSFRLSDEAKACIRAIQERWGCSSTDVVEVAVRSLRRWIEESAPPPIEPPAAKE